MDGRQRARYRRGCGAAAAAVIAALVIGAGHSARGVAQETKQPADPPDTASARSNDSRDCLGLHEIDRTDVVDDDTVLFYLRDGDVYRNDLKSSCPELKREDRFLYRVPQDQLCNIDTITVLREEGFGFREGASCSLGVFKSIDPDAATELLQQHQRN